MSVRATATQELILAKSGIPFIIAPTGTMANNGAITLGTALAIAYPSCYLNLPANAISAGSTAGWYYATMSSATLGTVFNNTYTSGLPTIPASPTAFATTGPGAYTGVTTAVTGQQITLPANSLGINGILRITTLWGFPNNANTKSGTVAVGGTNFMNASLANVAMAQVLTIIYNCGSQSVNAAFPAANPSGIGAPANAINETTVNFANSQTIAIGATIGTATDFMIMHGFLIEVLP